MLPQAEMTVNLLRQSNTTPNVSAYAHLFGIHSFSRRPLAPLGSAVQAHEKPDKRGSWAMHSVDGYYIGTSQEHHRCFRVWVKKTKAERVSDTIFVKHKYLTQPIITPEDAVIQAASDLKQAITGFVPKSNESRKALKQLGTSLITAAETPDETTPIPWVRKQATLA